MKKFYSKVTGTQVTIIEPILGWILFLIFVVAAIYDALN